MKRLSLVLSLVCFAAVLAVAQRTVVGTILDDSGETLIGASETRYAPLVGLRFGALKLA